MTVWHEPQFVRRMFLVSQNDSKKQLSGDLLVYLGELKLEIEPKQVTKLKRLNKDSLLAMCSALRYFQHEVKDVIDLFSKNKVTITEQK